jgi:integrase
LRFRLASPCLAVPDHFTPATQYYGKTAGLRRLTLTKLNKGDLTRLLKEPGRHAFGLGLYFRSIGLDRAYWVYRFRLRGKETEMSLGPYPELDLAEAREKHAELRKRVVVDKIDVHAERRKPRSDAPTFGEIADDYLAMHEASWRNAKHKWQWRQSLVEHCAPIRNTPVDQIDTATVLALLKPYWVRIPETASRLRGRVEVILDAAKALGHVPESQQNVARWKNHLASLLPNVKKLTTGRKGHLAALPYVDLPDFLKQLRQHRGTAPRALEMIILCASRPSEVLGMVWSEIELDAPRGPLWRIPGTRMKVPREHVVPLSDRAVAILRAQLAARRGNDYVFPSPHGDRPLTNSALGMTMRRLGMNSFTVHGTARSGFRDWAAESGVAFEVAEACLAHQIGNAVTRAYLRTSLPEQSRPVMQAYADFVSSKDNANVVALKRA